MKILYVLQGTGNGHLAKATEMVPLLKSMAHTDVLVSGTQADLKVPFKIDYRFPGMSFIVGQNGGVVFHPENACGSVYHGYHPSARSSIGYSHQRF